MTQIPSDIAAKIRDRRALLWVSQGYDLLENEEPHDYDLPPTEATIKYRHDINPTDKIIASLYWEAIWLEGAKSPILQALHERETNSEGKNLRPIVVLSGTDDSKAQVSSDEFLTICSLPGLIDPLATPGAQYGSSRARVRERIAWELASRLTAYKNRILIVLGIRKESDLARLYEVLEDAPVTDLTLLFVLPESASLPNPPANRSIQVAAYRGTTDQFCATLAELGAPDANALPEWAIRVGRRTVCLGPHDVHRILKRFALITERDLVIPSKFKMEDLHDFLLGSLDSWAAYSVGLPVLRSYTSEKGLTLFEEVEAAFNLLGIDNSNLRTYSLKLPCQPGAGATTLLRMVAHDAAKKGHPTLVLKPDQVDIDLEEVLAFTTALSEGTLASGAENTPPFFIVIDAQQSDMPRVRLLSQQLAGHGRSAVILQATTIGDGEEQKERRMHRMSRLKPLLAIADEQEITRCQKQFSKIAKDFTLPMSIPSIENWQAYDKAMHWLGGGKRTTMFWVALRFFLTEGVDLTNAELAKDALGTWINRRMEKIDDPKMRTVVSFVAALSTYRIISPLWTVLRPVTGGTYSSEISDSIRKTEGIIIWDSYSQDLSDQVLRFAHPVIADEYLRRENIATSPAKFELLTPLLSSLSPGHPGDVWVAETLAVSVLAGDRQSVDWEWRIAAFDKIPPAIREQSKAILHHWARCLYLSAEKQTSSLSVEERGVRLRLAIEKLKKATEIERKPGRDEHPSHLFNTLGTAYARYASFLDQHIHDRAASAEVWNHACKAFQKSIAALPGSNIEALLAFSQRLLTHARVADQLSPPSKAQAEDVAYALSLLDEADDILGGHPNPDPQWQEQLASSRADALLWLDKKLGQEFLSQLQNSESPEVGYYCEARIALKNPDADKGRQLALAVFKKADEKNVKLGPRALSLRIMVTREDPILGANFGILRGLYRQLEAEPDYVERPIDMFRHAVLCYQTGSYTEGAERFARLREYARRSGTSPLSIRDVWRSEDNGRARVTQVRVSRIITEWRAEGYIEEFKQTVVLRPRHFSPPPREREVVRCVIRFEANGPLAVPPRFEEGSASPSVRR